MRWLQIDGWSKLNAAIQCHLSQQILAAESRQGNIPNCLSSEIIHRCDKLYRLKTDHVQSAFRRVESINQKHIIYQNLSKFNELIEKGNISAFHLICGRHWWDKLSNIEKISLTFRHSILDWRFIVYYAISTTRNTIFTVSIVAIWKIRSVQSAQHSSSNSISHHK